MQDPERRDSRDNIFECPHALDHTDCGQPQSPPYRTGMVPSCLSCLGLAIAAAGTLLGGIPVYWTWISRRSSAENQAGFAEAAPGGQDSQRLITDPAAVRSEWEKHLRDRRHHSAGSSAACVGCSAEPALRLFLVALGLLLFLVGITR